jgi:hypothetical protein
LNQGAPYSATHCNSAVRRVWGVDTRCSPGRVRRRAIAPSSESFPSCPLRGLRSSIHLEQHRLFVTPPRLFTSFCGFEKSARPASDMRSPSSGHAIRIWLLLRHAASCGSAAVLKCSSAESRYWLKHRGRVLLWRQLTARTDRQPCSRHSSGCS